MHTIVDLIEARSRDHSDDIFLSFAGETTTFRELREQVRKGAAALRRAGLAPNDRVLVIAPNRPDHVVLYLALAWIGCTIIETSTLLKRSGIEMQLEDSDPQFVIADPSHIDEVRAAIPAQRKVRLLALGPSMSREIPELDLGSGSPDDGDPFVASLERLQSISYTSGTTGRPKGVMLTERYFQIGAKNAACLADVGPKDVLFLWEPFYHIAAWMSVLVALQHGVRIELVERFSASRCWDQIRAGGATLFHYLGGAVNILLRQPELPADRENPIRIAWGAAAPAQSWREFETRFGVRLREGYGISEAQNFTHLNLEGRVGSIGKPVAEFDSWIAGDHGERLPPRMVGEIVVKPREAGVTMVGYFRDPQKTAEVLRDGCVFTGDLGYIDEDGYFYYAGRKKDSLRRRGENVSAWEVERVINAHPDVEESAVVGVTSDLGEQDIRAFIKLAEGKTMAPLDMIKWCERDLAYYQIPRFVDFVSEFPRGPTQRIQKSHLPTGLTTSWDIETSGYQLRRR
jgi:crotonobetaine/carnitine-CoA ligase